MGQESIHLYDALVGCHPSHPWHLVRLFAICRYPLVDIYRIDLSISIYYTEAFMIILLSFFYGHRFSISAHFRQWKFVSEQSMVKSIVDLIEIFQPCFTLISNNGNDNNS